MSDSEFDFRKEKKLKAGILDPGRISKYLKGMEKNNQKKGLIG